MSTFQLYADYSEKDFLDGGALAALYVATDVRLVGAAFGVALIASVQNAPSWSSAMQTTLPYFRSPESLYWYSSLENWILAPFGNESLARDPSGLLSSIHLFAHRDVTGLYCYLGTASLSSYGMARAESLLLCYTMTTRLARDAWVGYGGCAGWMLTIGQSDYCATAYDEAALLIDRLWGVKFPYVRISRYEGDVLQASTNEQGQAIVNYLADAASPECFSGRFDGAEPWVLFKGEGGDDWELPFTTVVTREEARSIIKSYLSSGRPIGLREMD